MSRGVPVLGRSQHGVERHALPEEPDGRTRDPSAAAPAAVARCSRCAAVSGNAARGQSLLHEVGLQALLEQRQPGAGADVGAERDTDAGVEVRAQREQPAARGTSCWSGSARRPHRRRPGRRARPSVGCTSCASTLPRPEQPVPRVGRRVYDVAVREQLAHPRDLGGVLVQVGGEQRARDVVAAGPRTTSSSSGGAREREARRHGVAVRGRTPCHRFASASPSS